MNIYVHLLAYICLYYITVYFVNHICIYIYIFVYIYISTFTLSLRTKQGISFMNGSCNTRFLLQLLLQQCTQASKSTPSLLPMDIRCALTTLQSRTHCSMTTLLHGYVRTLIFHCIVVITEQFAALLHFSILQLLDQSPLNNFDLTYKILLLHWEMNPTSTTWILLLWHSHGHLILTAVRPVWQLRPKHYFLSLRNHRSNGSARRISLRQPGS